MQDDARGTVDALAGIPAEARASLEQLLEGPPVPVMELRLRLEAFRVESLSEAGTGDLAAMSAVAVLIALAFTLLGRLEEDDDWAERRLVAAALTFLVAEETSRDAGDAVLRAVALRVGEAPVEVSAPGQPAAPRPPRTRLVRTARGAAAFAVGIGVIPLYLHLTRQSNPGWEVRAHRESALTPYTEGEQLRDGYSNIHLADYVDPSECAECHEDKQELLVTHPHNRMNALPGPDSVQGDFSNHRLDYGDYVATFDREGDRYRMSLEQDGEVVRRWRVTRTVGSRFTQMYIGVQTEGPEIEADAVWSSEVKLPFGYWITRGRWLPVSYFDSDSLPDYEADGSNEVAMGRLLLLHRWERSCIFCHNTYPYDRRLRAGMQVLAGFPLDDLGLELAQPNQPPPPPERTLRAEDLISLGITCQSCHFGGRRHVELDEPMRFLPSAEDLVFPAATEELVELERDSAYAVNSICAQCHAANVSLYPDGSATWNSREAGDMFAGDCATEIKCTDCHDPHQPGPPGGGPDALEHLGACLSCHEELVEPSAQTAHSNHSARVTCLDCHMPRRTQGLDEVIRTHRIGSPTDRDMLRQGAPNACNLCHLERSIRWTTGALREGWGVEIEPGSEWAAAYGGDLDAPVGEAWLRHEVPVTRLVAASAWARSPKAREALPRVIALLEDPNPVNRMFAMFAVEKILGARLSDDEYRPTDPPAERRAQVRALLEGLR
jgi:Cytochrome c552